jgi:hypothetical protein
MKPLHALPPEVQRMAKRALTAALAGVDSLSTAQRIIERYLLWDSREPQYPAALGHPEPPPADLQALVDRCKATQGLDARALDRLRTEVYEWRGANGGTALHWAATHAQGAEIVHAIGRAFAGQKDNALVARRQAPDAPRQEGDETYRLSFRGWFGKLSLLPDAEGRLALGRANHPEVVDALCQHGADPRDDAYCWIETWDAFSAHRGIRPAICYAESPEVYDALVKNMGSRVQVNAYQAEHAHSTHTLRLMASRHPQALRSVMESGTAQYGASMAIEGIVSRPRGGGMLVSHFADPEMTKAALMGVEQALVGADRMRPGQRQAAIRNIIDKGTSTCNGRGAHCAMPLRCPSLESAKMLCAWRCAHAKDAEDWRAWSQQVVRDLEDTDTFRPRFEPLGRRPEEFTESEALKEFLGVLTAVRPMLPVA